MLTWYIHLVRQHFQLIIVTSTAIEGSEVSQLWFLWLKPLICVSLIFQSSHQLFHSIWGPRIHAFRTTMCKHNRAMHNFAYRMISSTFFCTWNLIWSKFSFASDHVCIATYIFVTDHVYIAKRPLHLSLPFKIYDVILCRTHFLKINSALCRCILSLW